MKRIIVSFILAIITLLAIGIPVYADTALPDTDPLTIEINVYRNLRETDDRMFVIFANTQYASLPATTFDRTFIWQLIDSDGVTVLGSTVGYSYVDSGYGYQVYSLYFPASAALTWQPATAYTIRLLGNPIAFDTPPVYNYTVNNTDYTTLTDGESVRAELGADILVIAEELDLQWGLTVSLISEDEAGQYLSTFGQAYFRGCIYSVQTLAPSLFPLSIRSVDIGDRAWTDDYVTELQDQYTGTWVETAKAAGGALFGTTYDLFSLIMLLVAVVGIIIANIYITNDYWNGLIDAGFVMIITARLGVYDLGILGLICAICVIFIAIKFWGIVKA